MSEAIYALIGVVLGAASVIFGSWLEKKGKQQ